jgi:hypothetical protein
MSFGVRNQVAAAESLPGRGQTSVGLGPAESDALALGLAPADLGANSHGVRHRGEASARASASSCSACLAGPVRTSVSEDADRIWLGRCSSSLGRLGATRPRTGQPCHRAFQFGDLLGAVVGQQSSRSLHGAEGVKAVTFRGCLWYSRCRESRGVSATLRARARSKTRLPKSCGGCEKAEGVCGGCLRGCGRGARVVRAPWVWGWW